MRRDNEVREIKKHYYYTIQKEDLTRLFNQRYLFILIVAWLIVTCLAILCTVAFWEPQFLVYSGILLVLFAVSYFINGKVPFMVKLRQRKYEAYLGNYELELEGNYVHIRNINLGMKQIINYKTSRPFYAFHHNSFIFIGTHSNPLEKRLSFPLKKKVFLLSTQDEFDLYKFIRKQRKSLGHTK